MYIYGIKAYFTYANPRFDLGTPAGWTEFSYRTVRVYFFECHEETLNKY